jgi:putative SOS response-associated peptidase YedK
VLATVGAVLALCRPWQGHYDFAIVTTDAAPSVSQYHNRIPVVLEDAQFDDWMRGTPDQAAALMNPTPARSIRGKSVPRWAM